MHSRNCGVAVWLLLLVNTAALADTLHWEGSCDDDRWWGCCEHDGQAYNNWHISGFGGSCPTALVGEYPQLGDDAIIDAGSTVAIDPGAYTFVTSLVCDATLQMQGIQLAVEADALFRSSLLWDSGALTGTASVAIFNIGDAGGGSGMLVIRGGGGKDLANAMVILNSGSVCKVTGSGDVIVNTTSSINIDAGAVFDAQADAVIRPNPFDGPGQITNAGALEKTAGAGAFEIQIPVLNTGTVNVEAGTLRLKSGTSSGSMFVSAGSVLEIGNAGDYTGSGDYHLAAAATCTGAGWLRVANGGRLVLDDGASALAGNVQLARDGIDASIRGPGDLSIGATLDWLGGAMDLTGTTYLGGMAVSALRGADSKTLSFGRVLSNSGQLSFQDAGDLQLSSGAVLRNEAAGSFDILTDADVRVPCCAGSGSIENFGLMRKRLSAGTTTIDTPVTNDGTLVLESGVLELARGLTQTGGVTRLAGGSLAATGGEWIDIQGGVLEGGGNIAGKLRNAAEVRPGLSPGALTILTGNPNSEQYEQTATGVLSIELGGTAPGSGYDQLNVGWYANLNGTLRVRLIDGFIPAAGSSFDVLLYSLHTGSFSHLDLPTGVAGRRFFVRVLATSVVVRVERAGDANCDGSIDFFDIDPFLLALFDPAGYATAHPNCDISTADVSGDGTTDFFDIDPFLNCLFNGCP